MTALNVVIRADASLKIGSGHVMRCLTLAEALRDSGAEVAFIARAHPGNFNDLIRRMGFLVHELPAPSEAYQSTPAEREARGEYTHWLGVSWERDAEESIATFQGVRPDWLVVDHYGLERHWEQRLRLHVHNIMVIDDLADRAHDCDLLLDQNFVRNGASRYEGLVPPHCTQLLGPRYTLLRPEFTEVRKRLKPRDGSVTRVLVFFGGVDPDNITGRALEVLSRAELAHLDVDVVLGANNPHSESIKGQIAVRPRTQLHTQIDNIADLMAHADLALGAGGGVTWERLCLGLPSLVVTVAKNQEHFTDALDREGYLTWLGPQANVGHTHIMEAVRKSTKQPTRNYSQSEKAMELVSGDGAQRVVGVLTRGIEPEQWYIREATIDDCELYWVWVNDPEVRSNAFHPEMIAWDDHQSWFHSKLTDDEVMLLVVESNVGPVGQVRFGKEHECSIISYSLGRQFRGFGLGKALLAQAMRFFLKSHNATLVGEVMKDNHASARIFEGLGFIEIPSQRPGSRRFRLSCHPDSIVCHGVCK